jgi:hypothetical protein
MCLFMSMKCILIEIKFDMIVMPVCMASYIMAGYGHVNHSFEG